jgi:lysozyme
MDPAGERTTEEPAMRVSEAGLRLIKQSEGFSTAAYPDSCGIWTIGYGHTRGVLPGDRCEEAQADAWLREDVTAAEAAVARLVAVPLAQGQFDALVDFVFNLGEGALAGSTLRRRLDAGDYRGAAAEFGRWCHAGGAVLPGLVTRRARERALFESGALDGGAVDAPMAGEGADA